LKDLIEFIAKEIASNPEQVKVTEEENFGRVVLKLAVADEDKGRIIGRNGRVVESIRVLLRVAAVKENTRATLEII
jgi:predicted RNA-binding protein YlqC (UPF0109 family)